MFSSLIDSTSLTPSTDGSKTILDCLAEIVKLMGYCSQVYKGLFAAAQTSKEVFAGNLKEQIDALKKIEEYCTSLHPIFLDFEKRERANNNAVMAENFKVVAEALAVFNKDIISVLLSKRQGKDETAKAIANDAKSAVTLFSKVADYKKAFEQFVPHFSALEALTKTEAWGALNQSQSFLDFTKGFSTQVGITQFFFTFLSYKDHATTAYEIAQDPKKYQPLMAGGQALWNITSAVLINQFKVIFSHVSEYLPKSEPWPIESLDQRLQALQVFIGIMMPDRAGYYSFVENYLYDYLASMIEPIIASFVDISVDTLGDTLIRSISNKFSPTYYASTLLLSFASIQNLVGPKNQDFLNSVQLCLSAYAGDLLPLFVTAFVKFIGINAKTITKPLLQEKLKLALKDGNLRAYVRDCLISNVAGVILNSDEYAQLEGSFEKPPRLLWMDAVEVRERLPLLEISIALLSKQLTKPQIDKEPKSNIETTSLITKKLKNLNTEQQAKLSQAKTCYTELQVRKELIKQSILTAKTLKEMDDILSTDLVSILEDIKTAEKTYYTESAVIQAGEYFKAASYDAQGRKYIWNLHDNVQDEVKLALKSAFANLYSDLHQNFRESLASSKSGLTNFKAKLATIDLNDPKSQDLKEKSKILETAVWEDTGIIARARKGNVYHPLSYLTVIIETWLTETEELNSKPASDTKFGNLYDKYKSCPFSLYNIKTDSYELVSIFMHRELMSIYLLKLIAEHSENYHNAFKAIKERSDRYWIADSFGSFVLSQVKTEASLEAWHKNYLAAKSKPVTEKPAEIIEIPIVKPTPITLAEETPIDKPNPVQTPEAEEKPSQEQPPKTEETPKSPDVDKPKDLTPKKTGVELPKKQLISESEKALREDIESYIEKRKISYKYSDLFWGKVKRMPMKRKLNAANSLVDAIDYYLKKENAKAPDFDLAALSEGTLGKLVEKHKDAAEIQILKEALEAATHKRFGIF